MTEPIVHRAGSGGPQTALVAAGALLVAATLLGYFAPWEYVGFSLMITAFLDGCLACRLIGIDSG
jgi:hypothetical protein